MNSPAISSTTAANRNTCQGLSMAEAKSTTQRTTAPSTVITHENTEAQAMISITTEVSVAVTRSSGSRSRRRSSRCSATPTKIP